MHLLEFVDYICFRFTADCPEIETGVDIFHCLWYALYRNMVLLIVGVYEDGNGDIGQTECCVI